MSSPYWPSQQPPPPPRPDPPASTNGMAVASLVLGIVGIPFFWLIAIPSTLAVIFGGVGIGQIDRPERHQSGRAMAIWGIALGVVGIVGFLVLVILAANGVIKDPNTESKVNQLPARACDSRQLSLDWRADLTDEVCIPGGPTFSPPPRGYRPAVARDGAIAAAGASSADPTVHPFLALATGGPLSGRHVVVWVVADDASCGSAALPDCVAERDTFVDSSTGTVITAYSWDSKARPAFFGPAG